MQALLDANAATARALAIWTLAEKSLGAITHQLVTLPKGDTDYQHLALAIDKNPARATAMAKADEAHAHYDATRERNVRMNARLAAHEPRDDTQPPTAAGYHSNLETP
jgi:hypothetical protein